MKAVRILAILLFAHVVFGSAAAAETVKLATLAPKGSPWYEILRDIAEAWKSESNGAVELKIYPGGIAGDEPDMVRKMRIGQLHGAALTGVGLSRIAQEIAALQMPMMFRSDAELNFVRERIRSKLEAAFERQGFKILAWGDAGWVRFFTKQPVRHPDDLKPLRLFTFPGETAVIDAYKDAGYRPVPLPATEILTGLQSGLIDAVPTTPIAALSFQWFGVARHMTDVRWAPLVGALIITRKKWQALPAELRPRLLAAAERAGKRLKSTIRQLDDQAIEIMQKHGLTVHDVPADVIAIWEARARTGYRRIVGPMVPADMAAEVERLRDMYRADHAGQ